MPREHLLLSSPANGSAEWPPDDRLRRVIQYSETRMRLIQGAAAYWIARSRLRQGYAGPQAHSAAEALAKAASRATKMVGCLKSSLK
jgi:hypothetical protein